MNTDIRDSVGDPKIGAVNRDEDIRTVQGLLNMQIVKDRRSERFVAVDGRVGSQTLGAIGEFQRRHSLAETVLIKRGDATIHALATFSGPRSMRASSNLFEFLKQPRMEGYSRVMYDHDGAGNTTIGVGHLVHLRKKDPRNPSEKEFKNGLTDSQVEQLFWEDIRKPTSEINSDVRVPLTQNQFDALVSLTFNIGTGGFDGSTVLRLLNCGDYLGAARHFEDFHYSHHEPVSGLPWRRRNEEELFLRH